VQSPLRGGLTEKLRKGAVQKKLPLKRKATEGEVGMKVEERNWTVSAGP